MAKKKADSEWTLADQVAEYVGKPLGDLMNRRDALLKEVAAIDGQVASVRSRVAKQFGKWVPYAGEAAGKAAGAASAAARKGRRKFSAAQRAEVAERMKKYWAKRKKAAKKGGG